MERGISDGDRVRAQNGRGPRELVAVVAARAGVVVSPSVWWDELSPGGVGVSRLTSQAPTDLGGGATFYDAPAEVEKK